MVHETVSIDPGRTRAEPATASSAARGGDSLARLAAGTLTILLDILVRMLIAVTIAIGIARASLGAEGFLDFYDDLRFDIPLETRLGAVFVSCIYLSVASATLSAAMTRRGRGWRERLAVEPPRGRRWQIATVALVTLLYAAVATLFLTFTQTRRIVAAGPTDYVLLATLATNLVLLAPFAEELFFRGWLYTGLRQRLAFWPSFLITASLFAAIHWDANHRRIFLVAPLAIALGVLRELTGSIKTTMALHALYNLIIVTITLLQTW